MREFLDPYDKRLNTYSKEVSVSDLSESTFKSLFDDMLHIAKGERDESKPNGPTLVGLSAPQIGEFLRVILVDTAANPAIPNFEPELRFFINPRIVKSSSEESLMREGCYSTGKIAGAVMRPESVTVIAIDEFGKEFEYSSAGIFQSHILQHEIDHLNGIRFPSRIRDTKYLHIVEPNDFQNYRQDWMNWPKLCPYEDWLKMYEGIKCDA